MYGCDYDAWAIKYETETSRIMSTLRRTSGIVPEMSVSGIPETDISGIYQKRYLTFLVYTRIAGEYSGNVYFSYSTRNDRF